LSYKLVAIDMDGTLLNSEGKISNRTRQAINEASNKGVYIVLATGRILKSALNYSSKLNLNKPIISSNGALIIDENKRVIYEKPMDLNTVKEIVRIGLEEEIYYHFYDEENFYANVYIEDIIKFYNNDDVDKENQIRVNIFKDIDDLILDNINVYKFLFIDNDISRLNSLKYRLNGIKGVSISSSWSNNLEVMDQGVSKGNSLKFLCEKLNISAEEVIAIGDNENDISMIEFAGLGVAMENGVEKVKSAADLVTSSNDEDGVAKVIEKYIL